MLEARVATLNQSTEVYTFDNNRARTDINVTIVNEAAPMWATYEWRVDEWKLGDHNIITFVAEPTTASAVESIAPVSSCNARWRLFKEEMVSRAAELPENFSESPLDQQVSTLRSIVYNVCDSAISTSRLYLLVPPIYRGPLSAMVLVRTAHVVGSIVACSAVGTTQINNVFYPSRPKENYY